MKKFLKVVAVGSTLLAVSANAAIDVSGIQLDVSPVETLAGVMLGGLAIIYVAKRVIGFLR